MCQTHLDGWGVSASRWTVTDSGWRVTNTLCRSRERSLGAVLNAGKNRPVYRGTPSAAEGDWAQEREGGGSSDAQKHAEGGEAAVPGIW